MSNSSSFPFEFNLDTLSADFSFQGIGDELMSFDMTDSPLSSPPLKRSRKHRRSNSEPLPNLQSHLDMFDDTLLDSPMSDIFTNSEFAGLVALPQTEVLDSNTSPILPLPQPRSVKQEQPVPTAQSVPQVQAIQPMQTVESMRPLQPALPVQPVQPMQPTQADSMMFPFLDPANPVHDFSLLPAPTSEQWHHSVSSRRQMKGKSASSARAKGYVCGRCGQPKRGHICPAVNRPVASSGTQVDLSGSTGGHVLTARPRSIL